MITPEILKQVKAIELRTRGLVGTLSALSMFHTVVGASPMRSAISSMVQPPS